MPWLFYFAVSEPREKYIAFYEERSKKSIFKHSLFVFVKFRKEAHLYLCWKADFRQT
mgnify:FL=1|jgi:hypothetical protein|nr:MAG TPA: hypothetical protein [Caudoviricetes sp.]